MNSRLKELFSNTMLFAIANFGSKVLVFLMVPLYTSVLSTKEFGATDLITTIVSLLIPLFTVSIVDGVLRYCFLKEYSLKEIFSAGLKVILAGFILVICLYLTLQNLHFFEDIKQYLIFVPALFITTSVQRLLSNFARGIDKVKASAFNGIVQTFCMVSLNLLFLLVFKLGVLGYLYSLLISELVSIIYLSICVKPIKYLQKSTDWNLTKDMILYSAPLVPNSISWWMLGSLNRFLLKFYLGLSAVGAFAAAMRIPTILTVITNIFAEAWLLSAMKDYGTDESKSFIPKVYKYYFTLTTILTAVNVMLSKPLANLLLSGEFKQYWFLIPFLLLSVYFGALSGFLGAIFSAEKKTSLHFVSTMIGAVVSLLATILFIEEMGIILISVSIMLGNFFVWLIREIMVKKYMELGVNILKFAITYILLFAISILTIYEFMVYALGCLSLILILHSSQLLPFLNVVKSQLFKIRK